MDLPEDISREDEYLSLLEDISNQAVDQFTFERLRSYYVENRDIVRNVFGMHREARELLEKSPTAALVLFTTTIEVGLKVALLKPVVYGLVHNQSVADLISDLAIKHNGLDRFKPLLARILSHYGNIDFDGFTIQGHSKTVWEEITIIQNLRNGVLHRAEPVQKEAAELARVVASMIIVVYLGSILERLNLKLGKGAVIEDDV